ncbi:hypothetical protein JCM3775_000621 [Rhodotorula graminis]
MDPQLLLNSSSSPNSVNPPPILKLPDELLDGIFILAYAEQAHRSLARKPICRRLYPFQRANLYRAVRVKSYDALASFCRTVKAVPRARAFVHELQLDMAMSVNSRPASSSAPNSAVRASAAGDVGMDLESSGDESDGEERVAEGAVKTVLVVGPRRLSNLFARLGNLKVLKVTWLDEGLLDFLLEDDDELLCARVEDLDITADADHYRWYNDAWLFQLAYFARLKSFTFELVGEPVLLQFDEQYPVFGALTRLSLAGIESAQWEAPVLAAAMPHLVDLELRDHGEDASFAVILRQAPVGLRRLCLISQACDPDAVGAQPVGTLDDVLPRFTRLDLTLCEGSFTADRLGPYLESLPDIHTLSFGLGAAAGDRLLRDLLEGPHRSPRLQHLTLDHVECTRGPTFRSKGCRHPPGRHIDNFYMWPGWWRAFWRYPCTEAGVAAAVRAAKANGVVVDGTALDTIGYDDEWEHEMFECLLEYGFETGDDSDVREWVGGQGLEDVIHDMEIIRREVLEGLW